VRWFLQFLAPSMRDLVTMVAAPVTVRAADTMVVLPAVVLPAVAVHMAVVHPEVVHPVGM